jgi:hypothetical protein
MDQEIRELAYCKWAEAGYPHGDGVSFWLEAENYLKEVKGSPKSKVAAKTSTSGKGATKSRK